MFSACFHIKEGSIDIPASFSQVISSDANFESITSDMAQELRLFRKDNVVANRMLIFVADGSPLSDTKFEITKDFFREELGFHETEMIKIQRSQVHPEAEVKVDLDDETKEKLTSLVEYIYRDVERGMAQQILQVAIVDGKHDQTQDFFENQNYELVMRIESTQEEDLQAYYAEIAKKIAKQPRNYINFRSCNDYFRTNPKLKVFVNGENKQYSSKFFNYKLYLGKQQLKDSDSQKYDFLNLKPTRIGYFNTDHQSYAAFA